MKRSNIKERRYARQEQADMRAEYRISLTNKEQLKRLDKRLGKNAGAKRERRRLKKS